MRRALRIGGAVAVIGYALLCAVVVFFERDFIYPVPRVTAKVHRATVLEVPDGTRMLWAPTLDFAPVVVYFHGNAEQIAATEWLVAPFKARNIGLAAVEYPGYPATPGSPTEATLVAAGDAALRYLTGALHISNDRIVLVGHSLGSGVAVQLAARGWGAKLVLLSPYTSLTDVAAEALPFLPMHLLITDTFDSATFAARVKQPVLIIHGKHDDVIPVAQGLSMQAHFDPPAAFLLMEPGDHNNLWDFERVHEAFYAFVYRDELTPPASQGASVR